MATNRFTILALCVTVASAAFSELELQASFTTFIKQFNKQYASAEETAARFEIFRRNLQMIESHNSKPSTYTLGITPFTDLTFEEFSHKYLTVVPSSMMPASNRTFVATSDSLPDRINWREAGAVSSVVHLQGECESSWAFSAAYNLEGAVAIREQQPVESYSAQEIIDCVRGKSAGCRGGWSEDAFDFVKRYGICREKDYPYAAKDRGLCAMSNCTSAINGTRVSWYYPVKSEAGLQAAVAQVPVSSGIHIAEDFRLYKSGVYDSDACKRWQGTHSITVIGYDRQAAVPYYLLKNTWGTQWGENGYGRIALGKDRTCKLEYYASVAQYKPSSKV